MGIVAVPVEPFGALGEGREGREGAVDHGFIEYQEQRLRTPGVMGQRRVPEPCVRTMPFLSIKHIP